MRKNLPTLWAAALSALTLFAGGPACAEPPKAQAPAAAPAGADFRYNKVIGAGQTVSIQNIMGTIRAEPSSSNSVEVVATKVSEGGDPSLVRVVANEHAGGVTICALYPGSGDDCEGHGRRHSQGENRNTKVRVEFVVRLPAGPAFKAANVSGNIDARGLRNDVRATAVSGDVDVTTSSGSVEASSVSGAVRVAMGAPREGGTASAKAVSGNVEIKLPAQSNFDADATTVSGRIETDFGLPVQRGFVGQNLHGRVGRGGPRLKLDTVSGGIRLTRSLRTAAPPRICRRLAKILPQGRPASRGPGPGAAARSVLPEKPRENGRSGPTKRLAKLSQHSVRFFEPWLKCDRGGRF